MFNFHSKPKNNSEHEPMYIESSTLESIPDYIQIGNLHIYRYAITVVEKNVDVQVPKDRQIIYSKGTKITLDISEDFTPPVGAAGPPVHKLKTVQLIGAEAEAFNRWIEGNSEIIPVELEEAEGNEL